MALWTLATGPRGHNRAVDPGRHGLRFTRVRDTVQTRAQGETDVSDRDRDNIQPVSGTVVPRFAGPSTFARLPELRDVPACDVAILGIPFDGGTSYRPGARFGPQAIRQAKPQGPYLLAGWSMGGTVAFEMARRLEGMGETVSGVIMIDAPSPYMDAYEADDIDFLLERLEPAAGISILDEVRHQESVQAKKQFILEQKKQLGLFPPDITIAEAEQRLAVHKHHNQLLCRYQPGAAVKAGIAFIKATEATAFDEKMKDPVTSWAEFTHRGVAVFESPGNHFNMFSNEHSPVLATQLHACIQALGD